jgi:hypothetical protein
VTRQERLNREPLGGDAGVAGYLAKGPQNEQPLGNPRVGDDQVGQGEALLAIEQQVEIDRSRGPALATHPPQSCFNFV